jgi:hypothetical protein
VSLKIQIGKYMNEWIGHAEFIVLLITILGSFYLLDGKIERQSSRTDRLYEMYCEVQKEIRDLYKNRKTQ